MPDLETIPATTDASASADGHAPAGGGAAGRHAPATPPAGGSRRKLILPVVALLLIAAGVWAVRQWSYGRAHESTDNAQLDGHLVPVLAKVGGYVAAVNVVENQHVDSAEVLVRIDESE